MYVLIEKNCLASNYTINCVEFKVVGGGNRSAAKWILFLFISLGLGCMIAIF